MTTFYFYPFFKKIEENPKSSFTAMIGRFLVRKHDELPGVNKMEELSAICIRNTLHIYEKTN
jgi:hypothetical protein